MGEGLLFLFDDLAEQLAFFQVLGDQEYTFFSLNDFVEVHNVTVTHGAE